MEVTSRQNVLEPLEWHHHASDLKHIKDIHAKIEQRWTSFLQQTFKYKIYYRYFKNMKVIQPLNFIKYTKTEAIEFLKKFGWEEYSHK